VVSFTLWTIQSNIIESDTVYWNIDVICDIFFLLILNFLVVIAVSFLRWTIESNIIESDTVYWNVYVVCDRGVIIVNTIFMYSVMGPEYILDC